MALQERPQAFGSFTITLPNGNRFFLRECQQNTEWKEGKENLNKNLLRKPVQTILEELEERKTQNSQTSRSERRKDVWIPETSELWVDKYRPSKFTELLSDHKINREVLEWVVQWKKKALLELPQVFPYF